MPWPSDGNSAVARATVPPSRPGLVTEADRVGATIAGRDARFDQPDRPPGHQSPFQIAVAAAVGVAVVAGCVELILLAGHALMLIGLARFTAIGLEPVVEIQRLFRPAAERHDPCRHRPSGLTVEARERWRA